MVEKLTDDRFLKDGFYQPKSKEEEKKIRSMGSDLTFEKLYKHCAEVERQNAELQKQVDELKEENGKLVTIGNGFALERNNLREELDELKNRFENKACCNMSENCSMVQQAIKKTAKEILQELWDETEPYGLDVYKWMRLRIQNIASRKGVEVE